MSAPLKAGQLGGLKLRKAGETQSNPTLLIYGEGGTGKTTLAASATEVPELCPVLHLNIENGADSIKANGDITIVDIDSIKELQDVYNELHHTRGAGFRTCVVDNLTEAQSQGLDHILKIGRNDFDFVDFDGASFSNGAWNRSSEQMRKLMRYFRDLPMFTTFIAWERDYSETSKPDYGPHFTKTFGKEAPGLVNDCYRLRVEGGKRILQTNRTDRVAAKDRTRTLPAQIVEPTMKKVHDYWTGKLVVTDEPEPETTGIIRKKAR